MDSEVLHEICREFRPYDKIYEECQGLDTGEVLLSLFEREGDVETIYSHKDDDYSGDAFAVYKYKNKYFYLYKYFGSCDEFNEQILLGFKQDIYDNLCDHIYEITYPFEDDCCNVLIHGDWTRITREHGDECYQRCYSLAEERNKQKEVERELQKTEYEK